MALIQDEERGKDQVRWAGVVLAVLFLFSSLIARGEDMEKISLPKPQLKGTVSVEEAIQGRRSVRSYLSKEVSIEDISQLLWACQGITDQSRGLRAAPSAGALYPLEIYVANKDGLFHYIPERHELKFVFREDVRNGLAAASYDQRYVGEAAIDIIITVVHGRITPRYGDRGIRYTDMEAGHAAENVFLQAVALGLDSVAVGAFSDDAVAKILKLPAGTKPLYILPVGYRK